MPDIYIAAIITSALSLGAIGGSLLSRASKDERWFLGALILIMLPMNALAFHGIRTPMDAWLSASLGKTSGLYHFARVLYAPLTEEPAKLWPLLIPWFYRRAEAGHLVKAALAIGLGFGVGEAWTVAALLSKSPEIAAQPWYRLGGYINERAMVCVMHAAFTAAAIHGIIKRRSVLKGLALAALLHFVGNFPIFLAQQNLWGLGRNAWMVILQLWVFAYFLLMGFFLVYMAYGRQWLEKISGTMECPECRNVYRRPIFFRMNLVHKCYEKCPHCKHWHFVSALNHEDKL